MEETEELQSDEIRRRSQRIIRQEGSDPTSGSELRPIRGDVVVDVGVGVAFGKPTHGSVGRGRSGRQHSPIRKVPRSNPFYCLIRHA